MATAMVFNDVNSTIPCTTGASWQDGRRATVGESLGKMSEGNRQDPYLSSDESTSSNDGYLRPVNSNSLDLNSVNRSKVVDNGQSKSGNNAFQGVSLLAGKYLLFSESPSVTKRAGGFPTEMSCVNFQTKEQFSCKVVPRNPKGLQILAAYHRLEESSDFINQVIEAILTPKVLYLIMPKHYGNVHSYLLEKRTLEEAEAANIFKQMVQAVRHCHSKGVILRDIKLGRFVFVDKSKTKVKLESLEDATLLVDPCNDHLDDKHGCPNYVSPEKAETLKTKSRYPGKASDVWCLGVILYTMLSGRYPFNDPNQSKLLNKIRSGNFAIPPGLSSSVSFLIKNLLRKSPAERPSCNEILTSPWLTRHCISTPPMLVIETEPINKDPHDLTQASSTAERKTASDQVVPNF